MSKHTKTSFGIAHQVESFFTGTQVEFEQSGEHFYCARGSTINKVSVVDGQVKAQITTKNEGDIVIGFALAPNDKLIVIAYCSGLITKFNLVDDTIQREFKNIHHAPISLLAINQSSNLLATGSSDGTVKIWNLINHYCSNNLKGVNGVVTQIKFHEYADKKLLFCSAGDDCIHMFDIESSKRVAKLATHCSTITDFQFVADGAKMISVGRDKLAVLWNIDSSSNNFGKSIKTIPIFESVESLIVVESACLSDLIATIDSVIFATIGEEGIIKFWDTKTGARILTQNEPPLSEDRNPAHSCLQLCKRPKHNQLCAVSSERDLFFYGLPRLTLDQQLQGHLDEILSATWFARDQYLALACNSNDLKIMELSTSKSRHLKGHNDIVLCVKSLPNDPFCLITSSKDCRILVWKFDPSTMQANICFEGSGHTHSIQAMAVSFAESTFYSCGEDTTIKRWTIPRISEKDLKTGTKPLISNQTIKAHDARIDAVAVSPNDQLVATGSKDKTAKIFSASAFQVIATLKGHKRGVYALQFSPMDKVIVTAADVCLRMWNLQDFSCIKTFQGHDCAVLNFSFFSSGLQIISIGSDGNMKLWDCKTCECTKTIDAHDGNTWSLYITNNDDKIVTGGQDEKLVIWRDTTEEEREEKLIRLQTQLGHEQDFSNYINKKKWRKALKIALKLESAPKVLSVIREILLVESGLQDLEVELKRMSLDQIDFMIECCLSWNATAKNSAVAQQVLYKIINIFDNEQLLKLPNLVSSMSHLKILTEKSFNRYERLVREATFSDFYMNCVKIS